MSIHASLREGIAALLSEANLVSVNGSNPGKPVASAHRLTPEAEVAIATYPVSNDPVEQIATIGIQVRVRTLDKDMRKADNLADEIFDALHSLHDVTLPNGQAVTQILWQSGAPLGEDTDGNWERSDNYYAQVTRPRDRY